MFMPTQPTENTDPVWGLSLQSTGCPTCKQAFLIPPSQIGQLCPSCGRGHLSLQPIPLRAEPPELLVPFQVDRSAMQRIFSNFVQGVWLHGDDFTPESLTQRAVPLFWPMWMVDAALSGDWQAEMGYEYQVKSSQESFANNQWRTHEVVENRTRWETRMGQIARPYQNATAPALSIHDRILLRMGNYELRRAQPYMPAQVGAAALFAPDQQTGNAWPFAREALRKLAAQDCTQAARAQHMRNFAIHDRYESLQWTQLLLPIYASYYLDDEQQAQLVWINGQTGTISGPKLASQRKGNRMALTALAVAGVLLTLGLLGLLMAALLPPLAAVGIILLALALGAGLFAIIPAAWPWQWNRQQMELKITKQ